MGSEGGGQTLIQAPACLITTCCRTSAQLWPLKTDAVTWLRQVTLVFVFLFLEHVS